MATLTFVTEGQEQQFELSGELSVGREAGNDVVLPEGGLSRKHCRFYEEDGQVFVEDFGSSNGTFVDGERIDAPTPVSEGQEILLANIAVQLSMAAARAGAPKRQSSSVRRAQGSSARTGQIAAPGRRPGSSNALATRKPSTPAAPGRNAAARRGSAAPAVAEEPEGGQELAPVVRATLKGMTGPWAGKRYALANLVATIGRVEGNDVVVDDDSVSRRHAEIRKSGRGYIVRDLTSANGTYLNGERITEAPLRPGDVIKFGVVEFSYSGPSAGKGAVQGGPAAAERKKKLILFGGGGAIGFIVLMLIIHAALSPPPQPVEDNRPDPGQQAPDVQALMGMCRSFSDTDGNTLDWKRAAQACDAVLKVDPINADARKLKRLSAKEMAQKDIYDHAHELFGLGQEEAAMQYFDKLDSDSFYFAQGRSDYRKAAEAAKKREGDACVSSERAAQYEKAWIACKQYEDIGCYQGVEDKYQRVFLELQRRFKGKDAWSCPEKYKRWLGSLEGITVDKRFEELKKKYTDPELAKAINLFAKDPVQGRLALQKYRDRGNDASRAASLLQFEDLFYSKHQSAYQKMIGNDLPGAGDDINQEINADHQVMPAGYEADVTMQDRDSIANHYADQGKIYFNQQRYEKAFEQCNAGYQFTHANLNVSGCLADLEQYASGLRQDSCDNLATIMKITRKESLQYKNAAAAKAKAGCN